MIKNIKAGKWNVLAGLSVVAILLYLPVLNKGFVSDDFTVLFRLIYTRDFTPPGFFRPGADFSLYSTYLHSGLNPLAYNLSNLFIHVLNAWLLFLVCFKLFNRDGNIAFLSILASFIFLIYPFHQEAIVWALGRGILLSTFFALLSVYILFYQPNFIVAIIFSALFYFLSLACYESGLFLPVVIFLILRSRRVEKKKLYWVFLLFSLVFLLHICFRYYFAGSVLGVYGRNLNSFEPVQFGYEYLKFWLRLVMEPVSDIYLFLASAIAILISLMCAFTKLFKEDTRSKFLLGGLVFIMALSFLIPAFFGITIRTTEGERFLYFPSIFFSVILALIFSARKKMLPYLLGFYTIASVFLITKNNFGWIESSQKVETILHAIRKNSSHKVYVYNLPGSKNGKYIFRNGFREALALNEIDTSKVFLQNIYEQGIEKLDQYVEPPLLKNDKGILFFNNTNPVNLKPPFCIVNITDKSVQVFQVGYTSYR